MLQEPFAKKNILKPRFQLVRETYCTIKFDILSRFALLATALTKEVPFMEVYLEFCQGSTFPFL